MMKRWTVIIVLVCIVLVGGFGLGRFALRTAQHVRNQTNTTLVSHLETNVSNSVSVTSNNVVVTQASPSTAQTLKQIHQTIQNLLHNPPKQSFDASGFVQYVFSQASVTLPRTISEQATIGTKIQDVRHLEYGDLVFFDLDSHTNNKVTFVGIYQGNHQFVAKTTHGLMSISLNNPYWNGKFLFGRHVLGS